MLNKINPDSHKGCKHYFSESHTKFILIDVKSSDTIVLEYKDYNHIIVILKGKLLIEYDEFVNTEFAEGEIVFMPSYSRSHLEALEESRVLIGTFEMPTDICIAKSMEMLWKIRSGMEYTFASVPIKPAMQQYLDLLVMYLESGMQCAHLHEIKEKELFLVLRWFYTDEEFVRLFYLIIGKSLDFRDMVIKNYDKVKSIEELARVVGMSRSNFDARFKKVFGMPPKQWMLQRKARSIRFYMTKPNVTIGDVIRKYGFESFTHFNRFSKQQFGKSPSELMKEEKKKGREE